MLREVVLQATPGTLPLERELACLHFEDGRVEHVIKRWVAMADDDAVPELGRLEVSPAGVIDQREIARPIADG